jgi:hypothetical protein
MNSEAETMGKQAVLAWKVDRGTFNGVSIDGLSVVAALSGDRNLGHDRDGRRQAGRCAPRSSSTRARTGAQQLALVAMANELSKGLGRHDRQRDAGADSSSLTTARKSK